MPHRRRRSKAKRSRRSAQPGRPRADVAAKNEPLTADSVNAAMLSNFGEWATSMGADPGHMTILPPSDSREPRVTTVSSDGSLSTGSLTHFLDFRTAYPTDFAGQWVQSPAREVIADYEQHGGDRRLLLLILWQLQLRDEVDAPYPARVIRALRRACHALAAALKSAPLRQGRSITSDQNLRMMISSQLNGAESALKFAQDRRRRRGRPAGITRKTLFTAVLASEFERVYGRPQMRAIAKLVGSNETHVRRLVDHASRTDVQAHLRFLRAQPAPQTNP